MKKILITNDDGIKSEGLWAMANALKNFEVIISAPMRQQSGMSHALTVGKKLEYKYINNPNFEVLTIDGTPTDCVKIYLEDIDRAKEICAVISGINDGANLATDVLYSGTVGAALEGFMHNIPAISVSVDINSQINLEEIADVTAKYFENQMLSNKIFFHNLNFPKKYRNNEAEFKMSRLGRRDYINAFVRHTREDGKTFFEIRGEIFDSDNGEGTDIFAVENGFISVTPLHFDVTNHKELIKI